MSVLTISGLSKTYATGFNALRNVNLEIHRAVQALNYVYSPSPRSSRHAITSDFLRHGG